MPELCLHIGIGAPVRHGYDYLPPKHGAMPQPGMRVRVPFGRQWRIGVVLEVRPCPSAGPPLKRAGRVLDEAPVVDGPVLELMLWAARYYQHPVGQVVEAALPVRLRRDAAPDLSGATVWRLTESGREEDLHAHRRAPVRQALLHALQVHPEGLDAAQLRGVRRHFSAPLKALAARGLVEAKLVLPGPSAVPVPKEVAHNPEQRMAVRELRERLGAFSCTLLHGVTGSGKTEVYRAVIRAVLEQGGQALAMVPEIGLVPQVRDRLACDARTRIAVYHSDCTERERYVAWLQARDGQADIVVGTRSAAFLPFRDLRLIIVDEEHDPSYKQQEGFRYHARDVAVYRAHRAGVPIVLGTATPSIETWRNVQAGKYRQVRLPTRAGRATLPDTEIVDVARHPMQEGLSEPLMDALRETLDRGEQALLFLNRRGFAPVLYVPQDETPAACPHCLVSLTYHQVRRQLRCHYCGFFRDAAPELERGAVPLGEGTQRVEHRLRTEFPGCPILRMDRDHIRGRRQLEDSLQRMRQGEFRIAIGTQMLCKGHDFPEVTLVGIVNLDSQLFSPRLRAPERMAQTLVQVSGRAGRRLRPGRVMLQTCLPRHPVLLQLLHASYEEWLEALAAKRQRLDLPPYGHWALLLAQHRQYAKAEEFLQRARNWLDGVAGVVALGPAPAMLPKQADYWRAQLLLHAESHKALERSLGHWLEAADGPSGVRWSLDVDPLDIA